jgi:manganese/zinc/iron transport system permease protein
MVIAPAVAARGFTDRLQFVFFLAAFFGAASGLIGNYLSVVSNLPTGPMIVLVGTCFALLSLFLAPKRGLLFRMGRIWAFRLRCVEENILKGMWKKGTFNQDRTILIRISLWRLRLQGWIDRNCRLTEDGRQKAASIVRLHRLWELYLTEELGYHAEKVHRTAEEMEHIITSEMEARLTSLLANPKHDPHQQPIPEKGL